VLKRGGRYFAFPEELDRWSFTSPAGKGAHSNSIARRYADASRELAWRGSDTVDRELSGWKQIAAYLEVSIPTARKYGNTLGLPVRKRGGRYYADSEEIDRWKRLESDEAAVPRTGPKRDDPRIRRSPGHRLLVVAELFGDKTYAEVLEPTIRDLQDEHEEALVSGSIHRARLVQVRGYGAFWSAVLAQASLSLVKRLADLWKALP
jgi:hypothetical protein